MAKVPFTVLARTAKLIGQENFATAEGAIVELVKNAYDADARNCIIIFENHDNHYENHNIYIIDNGVGMTSETILNHWMKIGTDEKLQKYESDRGRVKTGAKGIGRFALDRLGFKSEMGTVSKNSLGGSRWSVCWSDFEQLGIDIEDVMADLEDDNNLDLKAELLKQFRKFNKIQELMKTLDFTSGTILRIYPLKDKWEENSLKSLFDNLEVLIPPHEQPEFDVHLFSTNQPDEFGHVNSAYYDDYDYKVSANFLADNSNSIKIEITRNELDVDQLESYYGEIFDHKLMHKFPYTIGVFREKTFTLNKTIKDLPGFSSSIDTELIDKIGSFEFTFYFLKNKIDPKDRKKFPYKYISPANRKAWLSKFGGVKIFRDDFRVRPYGENGQDWLGLGDRQGRSPGGPGQKLGGYKIGSNQIAGTVKISRISNASFQDKSGREGIQENEVFELFRNLLIEIISVFERDRNIIMFCLSELAKQRFKDDEEKRKAQQEAARILRTLGEEEVEVEEEEEDVEEEEEEEDKETKKNKGDSTETEILLARATKIYEQELEDRDEEIRLLRGLASVGLIISSFAHELKGLRTRLIPRTDFLNKELKKLIHDSDLKSVNEQENPFYMIKLIQDEDLKLKHWLEYSLSTLKRDKRSRSNINLGEYFEKFELTWNRALIQRKVKVSLKGTQEPSNIIRAFEIDLDAIFNNLLSNSLTAFKEKKGNYQREVIIEWKAVNEIINIVFHDNGCGLAQEYKNDPDRIFEFNESSKRDRKGNKIGTGLGLHIVKLAIEDYEGAIIQLLPVKEGFSIGISFPTIKKVK